jgi:hypothetical protein
MLSREDGTFPPTSAESFIPDPDLILFYNVSMHRDWLSTFESLGYTDRGGWREDIELEVHKEPQG